MRSSVSCVCLLALAACSGSPFPDGVPTPRGPEWGTGAAVVPPESSAGRALVSGEIRFASLLFREVAASPGSQVVSPYGVFATLGMLREGARGPTAAALDATLGLGGEAAQGWGWLRQGLRSAESLRAASAVWLDGRVPPSVEFMRAVAQRHGGRAEALDVTRPEATVAAVDAWAARHTEGRIRSVLQPADVTPDLRVLLTNAVYFRDRWAHEFPRSQTRDELFEAAPGRTLRVPMMHLRAEHPYAAVGSARVLALAHRGGSTELLLLLPAEGRSLSHVEAELAQGALDGWVTARHTQDVRLSLPRFRVESSHDLVPALTALGAGAPFGPAADLAGIGIRDPLGPLFVGALRQRALLECDEAGTTAAAVTVAVGACSAPAQPIEFRCDRPFLFLLRHLPTGAVLFIGRYAG